MCRINIPVIDGFLSKLQTKVSATSGDKWETMERENQTNSLICLSVTS